MNLNFVDGKDPILRERIPEFVGDPQSLRQIADAILLLGAKGNGVDTAAGLAAPQVGLRLRMFVMNIGRKFVCINPKVLREVGRRERGVEGCLTSLLPGARKNVERSTRIEAEWTDQYGNHNRRFLEGFTARCFQHELDHLDGITIDFPKQQAVST